MKTKKLILLFLLFLPFLLRAQEESVIEKMDIMFNLNQIRFRVDKHASEKLSFRTIIKLRDERFEISEGFVFHLSKGINTSMGIGFKRFYGNDSIFYIVYGAFRGNFDWGKVSLNYGSDLNSHNVSSSIIHYFKKNIGIGISSSDEYLGPRIEYIFSIRNTKVRLHIFYTDDINYGIKIKF